MLVDKKSCYYCQCDALSPAIGGVTDHLRVSSHRWQFLKCASCGSLTLSPCPDDASLAAFYPTEYSPAPSSSPGRLALLNAWLQYWLFYRWVHRTQAKLVLRLLKRRDGRGLHLLDIGCGNGVFLKEAVSLGFAGVGCEQRDSAVSYVQDTLGIPAFQADAQNLGKHMEAPFKPGTFDVITAFHVVEHIAEPSLAIGRWLDLLKPGGSLILGVPVIDSLQAGLFGRHWGGLREAPRHVSVPSRQGMHSLLTRNHLSQVHIRSDGLFFNATAIAHSLMPQAMHGAAAANPTRLARITHAGWRMAGLLCAYLSLPLAFTESFITRNPGLCIVIARKPA